jgi:hypothetical protein
LQAALRRIMRRHWSLIVVAFLATVPGIVLRLGGAHVGAGLDAVLFGIAPDSPHKRGM